MSDLKVRGLTVDDMFAVTDMLFSITGDAKKEISEIIVTGAQQEIKKKQEEKKGITKELTPDERQLKYAKPAEVGIKVTLIVLQTCLRHAKEDMKKWMGSLIDKSPEEFGGMPIDTPLDILSALSEKEDLPNFFSKAFALYKKMNESAKGYMKK